MIAAMKGYRMTLIMPDNLSSERRASMAAFGAELILTPAAKGGMEYARDLAMQMQSEGQGRVLDQFANPDNPRAHYETTGRRSCAIPMAGSRTSSVRWVLPEPSWASAGT